MNKLVFLLLLFFLPSTVFAGDGYDIAVGQVTLNTPTAAAGDPPASFIVTFPVGAFSTTPAIFITPSNVNGDPMTLRVHSVTSTGFEVFVSESDGENNLQHPAIPFEYLAVEPGLYSIGGTTFEVGLDNVADYQGRNSGSTGYTTVNFSGSFGPNEPVLITELQTLNNDTTLLSGPGSTFSRTTQPFEELTTRNVDRVAGTFEVAIERAETSIGNVVNAEQIAWLLIEDGTDQNFDDDTGVNSVELKSFYSGDVVTGNCTNVTLTATTPGVTAFAAADPLYIGSQIGRDGGDGGWLRRCSDNATSVSVQIEEDLVDGEQNHTTEDVAFIAFSETFQITASDPDSPNINMLLDTDTIPLASAVISSLVPVNVSFTSEFGDDMSATPVVVPMSTDEGNGSPAMARVWNVTSSGFTIAQIVPQGTTSAAGPMTVDYMAVVPGDHELPGGHRVLAGTLNTNQFQGNAATGTASWDAISFTPAFDNPPAVLAAVQTINSEPTFDPGVAASPFLDVAMQFKDANGSDMALDLSQTNQGSPPSTETIGWIAAESASGGNIDIDLRVVRGTTTFGSDPNVEFKTLVTPVNIQGFDDGACDPNTFPSAFSTASPLVVATENSRNGTDGGWLRRCSVSATTTTMVIDEDQNTDTERSHGGTEEAGIFAFSDTFAWCPASFSHMKLGITEWDPINGFVDAKAIPGSQIIYTLSVSNLSRIEADEDLIELSDTLPPEVSLFVGDLNGSGCPFDLDDGSDPSGVSLTCSSGVQLLSSVPPCVSVDDYCPLSDFTFADDWDSADITAFRLQLDGIFLGSDGSTTPEVQIQYRVRIN